MATRPFKIDVDRIVVGEIERHQHRAIDSDESSLASQRSSRAFIQPHPNFFFPVPSFCHVLFISFMTGFRTDTADRGLKK